MSADNFQRQALEAARIADQWWAKAKALEGTEHEHHGKKFKVHTVAPDCVWIETSDPSLAADEDLLMHVHSLITGKTS